MVSFDFDKALAYLCDKTNFRYCRLNDVIENNGCPALQIKAGDDYVLFDLPFLILSLVVAIFFICFVTFLKKFKIKYKKQRDTRGNGYWRFHLVMLGVSVLLNGIGTALVAKDGKGQQVVMVLRGVCFNIGMTMLFWITLVDMQLMPAASWPMHIIAYVVSVVVGLLWFIELGNPTSAGIVMMGIGVPFICSAFHLLGMLPVVIYRKLCGCVIYLFLMFIFNIGSQIVDWMANGVICRGTTGILTGMSVAVLVFAFYRVMVQLYYTALKKAEREDGLPVKKKLLDATSSEDKFKPMPIECSDYTYSYTYTDSEEAGL